MTQYEKEKLFQAKLDASTKVAEVYAQECYGYPFCRDQARLDEVLELEKEAEKPLDEHGLWSEYDEWLYNKNSLSRI